MKFLVTGGCGFIGSHLVDLLIGKGHHVTVLDDLSTGKRENLHRDAELIVGDIRSADDLDRAGKGVDGCFHLAAVASVEKSRLERDYARSVNLAGTTAVFDASARQNRFPVVYASSAAVFGDVEDLPLTERSQTRPTNEYGADKLGSEDEGRLAWQKHTVSNIGLRFFNVYGPRQDPSSPYSGVISIFSRKVAEKAPIQIHGDGGQTRDFVYVADVADAVWRAMDRMTGSGFQGYDIYNICTGRSTSILDLANTLMEVSGNRVDLRHGDARQGDIRHSLGAYTKAHSEIGYAPHHALAEGLDYTFHALKHTFS